ncbi:MAG: hypothetical protein LC130_08830 [Bryobacterales bacterium]|nr:hypothetical protein [Bryobacterales bacterium]
MRKKIAIVAGCVALAGAAAYAFKEPVLIRLSAGSLPGDRRLILMSPFRDREPEKVARLFLSELKTNRCRELLLQAGHTTGDVEAFCAKEGSLAPDQFDLINRKSSGSMTHLQYIWRMARRTDFAGLCELSVQRRGSSWVVTDYSRAY